MSTARLPQSLDDLRAVLDAASPIERARFLSIVVDTRNVGELGERRREAVWEATQTAKYKVVAEALGVSHASVNKAVAAHNRRLRGDS